MNLLEQAQNEENRWCLFDTRSKYKRAAELYEQAGNLFRTENNFEASAKAYLKAGELYEAIKDYYYSIQNYIKASEQYKKFDRDSAILYLTKIKEYYERNGKLKDSAKILEQIGDLDHHQALTCYLKGVYYYREINDIHSSNKLRHKICDIYLNTKQYQLAGELYELIANDYSTTNSWSASEYYLNAIICFLSLHDYKLVLNKLMVYIDIFPKLSNDYRYEYVYNMVKACVDYNLQEFIDNTFLYDQRKTLEPWKVCILYEIRKHLVEIADAIL